MELKEYKAKFKEGDRVRLPANNFEGTLVKIYFDQYAKYLLREGSISEKRELLANLRSRLIYQNKKITLTQE